MSLEVKTLTQSPPERAICCRKEFGMSLSLFSFGVAMFSLGLSICGLVFVKLERDRLRRDSAQVDQQG